MSNISVPQAFSFTLLLIIIATCFPETSSAELDIHSTYHSLVYTAAPYQAPSPAHHPISPSPAQSPTTYHSSPPVHPLKPPTKAPSPAPHHSKPPTKAPSLARKLVAVQGVVYCKNCSYAGLNTFLAASPLSGATVELRCKNTKYMLKKTATTDKNGYFFLQAPKYVTTYGAHKCKVFLIQSPKTNINGGACSHATNLNDGVSGAFLFLDKKLGPPTKPLPFTLFSVGPFAFEPPKCYKH